MAVIKVQSGVKRAIPDSKDSLKEVVATLCYFYPAYTYERAMDLPVKTLSRMLKVAKHETAKSYLEFTQIARAAQEQKPTAYNKLIKRYERESNE